MRWILLVLLLTLGCIEQQKVERLPGEGIVITGIASEESALYPGDQFRVYATIENMGDRQAETVEASLVKYGSFKPLGSVSTIRFGGRPFMPPDLEKNSRGDIDQVDWLLEVPATRVGYDYPIGIEVAYDYSADSTLSADLMSKAKSRSGSQSPEPVSIGSSGPLQLTMRTDNRILNNSGERDIKLDIEVSTVGSGFIKDDSASCPLGPVGCIRKLDLYVPKGDLVGNLTVTQCSGADYTKADDGASTKIMFANIGILHSGSTWLSCNIHAKADLDASPDFKRTYVFRSYAIYRYSVTGEVNVKVAGEQ
jgi:hypothetical protein